MKKIISLLCTLTLVLSLAACAGAETWNHEASGAVVELPEGMIGEDISKEGYVGLSITDLDPDAPSYFIFMEYDEEYSGIWMEDLKEEDLQAVATYYAGEEATYGYQLIQTEPSPLIVMVGEENTDLMIVALLNGWFISVEVLASDGYVLAEGAYENAVKLLGCIYLPSAE